MQRFRWQIRVWLGLGLGVGLLVILVLVRLVDDWKRDFRVNFAETSPTAFNPRLYPIDSALMPSELSNLVVATANRLPQWAFAGKSTRESSVELRFVRSTRVFRFQDDITVVIARTAGGSRLTAVSRSRIGKGDLGQNPRNLLELLEAVRQSLPQASSPIGPRS